MSAKNRINSSPFEFMTTGMKVLAAIVVALTLVVSGLLIGIAVTVEIERANIVAVQDEGQFNPDDIMAPEGYEQIDDEGNPMSSGLLDPAMSLGGTGIPLYVVVGAGIVIVALYFGLSTRKLNANISKMRDSIQ